MVGENFDHAAFGDAAVTTLADHALEFAAQAFEAGDLRFDVGEDVARHAVDAVAGLVGLVDEVQEFADGVEREAEFARVADERQAVGVGLGVAPLAAFRARGRRHQAFLLVEADRLDFGRGTLGQCADGEVFSHFFALEATVTVACRVAARKGNHPMDSCCPAPSPLASPAYRRVLWIALFVNAAMFAVEVVAGIAAGSVSLQADALDFLGDAANYGLSLAVLSMGLMWRARAALVKGISMGLFGIWVIVAAVMNVLGDAMPHAPTMGLIGFLALIANVGVALLLYRYREGDANMRSVWLCTRNDAIGNVAVMVAALGVFGTGTLWPDIAVAAVMATLALSASVETIRTARRELNGEAVPAAAHHDHHAHHHG